MKFHVGDRVIHWTFGMGEIVRLEEKAINGINALYYVVCIDDLTLWVRADEVGESSIRRPTPRSEFKHLFDVLRSPGETLSADRMERKHYLQDLMHDGKLESVCRVVRDLTSYRQIKNLNEYDKSILERARSFLITEWKLSLSVSSAMAEHDLAQMLGG